MFLNVHKGEVQLIDYCTIVARVPAEGIAEVRGNPHKIRKLMFDCKTEKQRDYVRDFFREELVA